ncbi:hypothetical protein [Aquimarina sp. 2201CG5-10]|uniref:hypothetical protein n=1 Tax=Aquimarina callyspongiae TaxID=3098150 RepID=UPI002AB3AD7B|nr:hypothetical protein [Aquimarina sp. 2201CG5-10]MDY8137625.1 hypothetical protein [Aquimarina sp. 2201CG5-10]
MNKHPEYKLIQKCLRLIEDQLQWGDSRFWHNDVFIELSDKIQQHTHVLLSPTTLKRVWGKVNYDSAPSISTLNTLAQFAGFLNWRDFKNKGNIKQPSWIERKISPNLGIITISAAVMTILFLSFYSMTNKTNSVKPDYSQIQFSSKSITNGLPNSVIFNFNLEGVTSDSLLIQQFWDATKTIKIHKDQKQATGQYYYPGYFRAKLLIDGKIIKEHDLFIKTDNWLGTIDYAPIPKYIENTKFKGTKLSFSNTIINEIKLSDQPIISSFHYINELPPISGDNFLLETVFKNTYRDKWAVCQKSSIVIVGTKSAYIIPFSIPGCISEIGMMLSEVYLDGKKNDLSALGLDLSELRNIKVITENKLVRIFIDDNQVFSQKYTESIGDVVGIRFRFLGAGEVTNLRLESNNGITAFDNSFIPSN